MVDTVDTLTVFKGNRRVILRLTNRSDGTGESGVVKLNLSSLIGPDYQRAPTRASIIEAEWSVQGFSSVQINYDHTVPDEGLIMNGIGFLSAEDGNGLLDPKSAGGTGNLVLTTYGAALNATYSIKLVILLKQ